MVLPALTDSFTTSLIGMIFLALWVLPVCGSISSPEALIRYGSRWRAVRGGMATLTGVVAAWGLSLAVIGVSLGLPLGLAPVWSLAARADAATQASAFAASSMADAFSGPVEALVCSAAYTTLYYLGISALTLAVACRGHGRAAQVGLIVFVVWSVICSFSPLPIPPVVDAVIPASLGWAMTVPGGVVGGALVSVGILGVVALLTHHLSLRETIVRGADSVAGVLTAGFLIACASVLMLGPAAPGSVSRLYFAGANGDVLTYLLVAILPALYATWVVSHIGERLGPQLLPQAIRVGSYRKWFLRIYARQLLPAAGFAVVVSGGVAAGAVVGGWQLSSSDWPILVIGSSGVLAAGQLIVAVAGATIWLGAPLPIAWPLTVATFLIVGYIVPPAVGWANVAAPYSVPVTTESTSFFAVLVSTALAGVVVGFATFLASPARGDLLLRDQ
ncbi:hypothetical protein [Microbacterium aurum]